MDMHKKPFYKRVWFYVICLLTLGILALFVIPYGLNHRSIGAQLVDTASQFKNVHIGDEKDNWTEDQWNDYWAEHPEYTAVNANIDWESTSDFPEADDPRLDELPPDYGKLWGIDLHDLKTVDQYDAYLDHPILDEKGSPIEEKYIYELGSSGKKVVDVTLDGFILELNDNYQASWEVRSDSDPNGFEKYKKAQNLELSKKMNGKLCHLEIFPYEFAGGTYNEEKIDDGEVKLIMKTNPDSVFDVPDRFLKVKLDEAPYNTDTYAIQMTTTSPQECFDENLEEDVARSMVFLPPELKEKYLGSSERFPLPKNWPNPEEDKIFKISTDSKTGERILEHPEFGIKVNLKPEWRVKSYSNSEDIYDPASDFEIVQSNSCNAFFIKSDQKNLKDWLDFYSNGTVRELGFSSYTEVHPYKNLAFEAYEMLRNEIIFGSDEDPKNYADLSSKRIVYSFNNQIIEFGVGLKDTNPTNPTKEGACDLFYQEILNSTNALNSPDE